MTAAYDAMKKLAEQRHAGQVRKGKDKIPYIEHPKAVVQNLLDWGEPEDSPAVGIAWGHDLLEDTDATVKEILAASDETTADGICLLTHKKKTPKALYIQNVAKSGNRNAILVKISDRIQNSRDFVKLEGKLRAFRYLHNADCILEALRHLPQDPVLNHAAAAWKELDESLREDARHDAIRGCMLGGAAGDALGAPVEFKTMEGIHAEYGPQGITGYVEFPGGKGAITDDTQMALFTAEGLLRATVRNNEKGICAPAAVMRNAYLRWLKTQGGCISGLACREVLSSGWLIRRKQLFSQRAPGMTCISALKEKSEPEKAYNDSKGCGTVMRMAPVGLFLEPEMAYDYGCRFSALTHGHPTGIISGGAFAMLIAELLAGRSLESALDIILNFLDVQRDAAETAAALRKARTAGSVHELGRGWTAEEALAIGVYCALKHASDFRSGVLEAVNITGDSDSTGSITGNIIGVINGEKSIPSAWITHLREAKIVSQTADDLWKKFETGEDGHVTEEWWNRYPGF